METPELVRIARALGDPTRLAMYRVIAGETEISCGDLASRFPVAQPTVSHHVRVLVEAGLVGSRRDGQHSMFSIVPGGAEKFMTALAAILPPVRPRADEGTGSGSAARDTTPVSGRASAEGKKS